MKGRSKPVIKAKTDVLTFGRYKGWTVQQVLDENPSYIIWLADEKVMVVKKSLLTEAEELEYARSVDAQYDPLDPYWLFGDDA